MRQGGKAAAENLPNEFFQNRTPTCLPERLPFQIVGFLIKNLLISLNLLVGIEIFIKIERLPQK